MRSPKLLMVYGDVRVFHTFTQEGGLSPEVFMTENRLFSVATLEPYLSWRLAFMLGGGSLTAWEAVHEKAVIDTVVQAIREGSLIDTHRLTADAIQALWTPSLMPASP